MSLLNKEVQNQVRQALAAMAAPVRLLMFTQGRGGTLECDFCAETRQRVEEVADATLAEAYRIDKIPALAILADGPVPKDYGIRMYGIPSGYEFGTLLEDILMVSRGDPQLSPKTLDALKRLTEPVHIQVYVAPTCLYCLRAVRLAHKLAMASDLVTANMVEATEFPHLANRYHVYGVPRTVINEMIHIEGAVPEGAWVPKLMTVMDADTMSKLREDWQAHLN